jgi:ribosome-associated protein
MIRITKNISIEESEIEEKFIRSSGPGGQNVNRVATAVQLRFDVARSPSLSEDVKKRLMRLSGRRLTQNGILVIDARRHRTQEQNRKDAMERLISLVLRASERSRIRKPTRPTRASKMRHINSKKRRSRTKRLRQAVTGEEY